MTKKYLRSTLASALLVIPFVTAHAGLIIDSTPVVPVMVPVAAPIEVLVVPAAPTIEHIGMMPSNLKRVTKSMHGQSIGAALSAIVPTGWSGYISDSRIKNIKSVSFNGDSRPWPIVLEEILKANSLSAKLDWSKREMSVGVYSPEVR